MKIKILIPTHEKVDALFAFDLAELMAYTAAAMPEGTQLGMEMNIGTYIHQSRTELLQAALEEGATHVLWLDSDMRFPASALLKLLSNNVPIVGINYPKRRMPPEFVALKKIPWEDDEVGEVLVTNDETTGLVEVDGLGFGCVLMDTSVLANLPDPQHDPWFWFDKTPAGRTIGEDIYFCKFMLQDRLNQRIFVDQDLSRDCGHLGQFEFQCHHVAMADEIYEHIVKEDLIAMTDGLTEEA